MDRPVTLSADALRALPARPDFRHALGLAVAILATVATVLAGVTGRTSAQESETDGDRITVEWIYSEEGKSVADLPSYLWLADGSALLHDERVAEDARTLERLDPVTGERTPAVERAPALESWRTVLTEAGVAAPDLPENLEWPAAIDRHGRWAAYRSGDHLCVLELATATFRFVARTSAKPETARFAPDGTRLAFVRENDLHLFELASGETRRLTTGGSDTLLNGTLSWVYWEELFARRDVGYWWSEDSTAIAYLQTDESPVGLMHYLDFEPALPRVITQRYPKAGSDNPRVRAGIVEVDSGRTTWIDLWARPHEYVARVKWLPESTQVSVQTLTRDQTRLDLYFADRDSGAPTHVLTETDEGWVNVHDDLHFLTRSDRFLWVSERDGYSHLYLYARDGELLSKVTRGDWALASLGGGPFWLRQAVAAVDETTGWIYFGAQEKSSVERHLYRIRFDGTGMERLSTEDGTHDVTFRDDATLYFDAHSRAATLPELSLHEADGTKRLTVAPARPELIARFAPLQYPELTTIPADDGFAMPASILRPAGFDPEKRYPVILYVYGGPSAPTVADAWNRYTFYDQILLREGYMVVRVDNRSATAISKDLENVITGNAYHDSELTDLLAAVRWLKGQPHVDPERVGIWGWSGGGTFTLLALTGSEEFRAGISIAPVTDWRYYDTLWTEAFMKRPQANGEGYARTSLVARADRLHGRLFLVHGTYDDNVHPQNAWAFIDALVDAGKMFDLMIYPMRKHGIADDAARIHLFRSMVEFWKRNL